MASPFVFGIVLAGGEGKRLAPLTADRAKPAVPFGGNYRLIDFALSNLVNAGYFKIVVLTQYKSHSLDRHVSTTWRLSPLLGNYVTPVPAQMRRGPHWFAGSADAIYQNLNLLYDERPDVRRACSAPTTSTAWTRGRWSTSTSRAGAGRDGRRHPRAARPGGPVRRDRARPGRALDRAVPREADRRRSGCRTRPTGVRVDGQLRLHDRGAGGRASRPTRRTRSRSTTSAATSSRRSSTRGEAHVYDFSLNEVPGATERDRGYWRDVGTLDAFYDAHMDLISVDPIFNLYNFEWPILTGSSRCRRPSSSSRSRAATGQALDSMIVRRRRSSRAAPCAARSCRRACASTRQPQVEGSILMHGVDVGRARGRAQRDRRQERPHRARARRSASTSSATASGSSSRRTGSW